MLPITELRAAIPWGIIIKELPWQTAFICAVSGNTIIAVPILLFIEPLFKFFRKWQFGTNFFNWLFKRTRNRGKLIENLEFFGLILFVGIPLPITGAWTGCVAAFIFGIGFLKALLAIFLGILMSASIVTILTLSGKWLIY